VLTGDPYHLETLQFDAQQRRQVETGTPFQYKWAVT
jgi:hypothetical protein